MKKLSQARTVCEAVGTMAGAGRKPRALAESAARRKPDFATCKFWHWNLASWSPHFLFCKMGIITPMSKTVARIKWG